MSNDQEMNLTAAGNGIGLDFGKRLVRRDDLLLLMEQAAVDGLRAMCPSRWDKNAGDWVRDPDYRTRTQTLFGLLAQLEGEPVKRVAAMTVPSRCKQEAEEMEVANLLRSPALRATLRRQLDEAEAKLP